MQHRIRKSSGSLHVRSPQYEGNSLVFGPGGQASIVSPSAAVGAYDGSSSGLPPLGQEPSLGTGSAPTSISFLRSTQSTEITQTTPSVAQSQSDVQTSVLQPSQSVSSGYSQGMGTLQSPSSTITASTVPTTTIFSSSSSPTASIVSSTTVFPAASSPAPSSVGPTSVQSSMTQIVTYNSTATQSSSMSSETTSSLLTSAILSSLATAAAVPTASNPSPTPTPLSRIEHSTPFYIGIALGVIALVAIVAALIAWCIRLRTHARRRQEFMATSVPWAQPRDGSGGLGLEEGQNDGFGTDLMVPNEHLDRNWEPTRDRDAGEPKRSDSFVHTPMTPAMRETFNPLVESPHQPFNSGLSLADTLVFPLDHGPYPTTRPLPNHLVSADFSVRSSPRPLGNLQITNLTPGDLSSGDESSRSSTSLGMADMPPEFGTPRESSGSTRPRFLGLGESLHVPWTSIQAGPDSTHGRKNMGGSASNWAHLPPLPGEKGNYAGQDAECWTSSIRSGLANVYNVVTGTTSTAVAIDDRLTPAPQRLSRRSSRSTQWQDLEDSRNGLTRINTGHTATSAFSQPWMLEETGAGTGVVHIRGLGGYSDVDRSFQPGPSLTTLSLCDTRTIRSGMTSMTQESQIPLIHPKRPPSVITQSRNKHGLLAPPSSRPEEVISRLSSFHSAGSIAPSLVSYYTYETTTPALNKQTPAMKVDSSMANSAKLASGRSNRSDQRTRPSVMKHLSTSKTNFSGVSFQSEISCYSQGSERMGTREGVMGKEKEK